MHVLSNKRFNYNTVKISQNGILNRKKAGHLTHALVDIKIESNN